MTEAKTVSTWGARSVVTAPIGDFEVLGTLGQGAGSTILKIRRRADGKVYALKVITVSSKEDQKYVTQAQQEFDVAQRLDHPNLVKIHAIEVQRRWFRVSGARLLLEYVDGQPLSKLRSFPIPRLVSIFRQTARAIEHLHKQGFCHADVKPDNILVTPLCDVKLIDFGLVWRNGERKDRVQGTIEFLAPEQAQEKVVTPWTDIFNFGATMFRVLTGKPAPSFLRQADAYALCLSQGSRNWSVAGENPQVPAALDELVRQCLEVRPEDRPQTMRQVRKELEAIEKSMRSQPSREDEGT
jgi:serine/threonine-protein kinase